MEYDKDVFLGLGQKLKGLNKFEFVKNLVCWKKSLDSKKTHAHHFPDATEP